MNPGISQSKLSIASPKGKERKIFKKISQHWQKISYGEVITDYSQQFEENPVLDLLTDGSSNLTYILDMRTLQYSYISNNVESITGYARKLFIERGFDIFPQIIHPNDLLPFCQEMKLNWEILMALPQNQLKDLMFSISYRLIKPDSSFLYLLQQCSVLQLDNKGNIAHLICICSALNPTENEISLPSNTEGRKIAAEVTSKNQKALLSKRELEIVKLMAAGFSSKVIAVKLGLSFHTINTHRQNIIEKTKAGTSGGVIQYVLSNKLI